MSRTPLYFGIDVEETGRNITRLRVSKGLTVRNIQELMGLEQPQSVYKWERGITVPSLEHLMALSKVFDTAMEDILVWNVSEKGCSHDE